MTLSFDFTLSVAPDGSVTMPFALANLGVLPGVNLSGGWGLTADWKTMTQAQPGAPLTPYDSYPKPAQPAPPGGAGVFVTIDLLKAPILPESVKSVLGGGTPPPQGAPRDDGR